MAYSRLRRKMQAESISVADIAEAIGVSAETVEKWLDGTEELGTCDALAIQKECFPNASFEELFSKDE